MNETDISVTTLTSSLTSHFFSRSYYIYVFLSGSFLHSRRVVQAQNHSSLLSLLFTILFRTRSHRSRLSPCTTNLRTWLLTTHPKPKARPTATKRILRVNRALLIAPQSSKHLYSVISRRVLTPKSGYFVRKSTQTLSFVAEIVHGNATKLSYAQDPHSSERVLTPISRYGCLQSSASIMGRYLSWRYPKGIFHKRASSR